MLRKGGNSLTLWEEAVLPELIPPVPGARNLVAKGGERTFFISDEMEITLSRTHVVTGQREAEPGELLRDPDLKYVPDWRDNLDYRVRVTHAAMNDEKVQKYLLSLCKSSILFYCNTFCYTYDPRREPETRHIPFVLFPFQEDVMTWMVWILSVQEDGLIEKSRDMGATWMFEVLVSWLILFYPGSTVYETSMREEDVDNKEPDSLLGKLRYILKNLPEWMRGGWAEGERGDKFMHVAIPEVNCFVRGQKVESTSGRQGRASLIGADEFAHISDGISALEAFSSLASSSFYISTPNGMGNSFAHMAHDPAVLKKSLHWSQHPLKNKEWKLKERGKPKYYDDAIWDKEHEITYETSVEGRVFLNFKSIQSDDLPWCHTQEGPLVEYEDCYDVYTFTDLGGNDPCSTMFAQIKPVPPEYQGFGAQWLLSVFDEYESRGMIANDLRYMINLKPYRYRAHIVDLRTGDQGDSSGRSWIINLGDKDSTSKPYYSNHFRKLIEPGPPIVATGRRNWEEPTLDQVRQLLAVPGCIVFSKHGAPMSILSLQNWSYPIDKATRKPQTDSSPEHSQWSHLCKALCYGVDFLLNKSKIEFTREDDWDFRVISQGSNL